MAKTFFAFFRPLTRSDPEGVPWGVGGGGGQPPLKFFFSKFLFLHFFSPSDAKRPQRGPSGVGMGGGGVRRGVNPPEKKMIEKIFFRFFSPSDAKGSDECCIPS